MALHPDDWDTKHNRSGHLLEFFVLQQLIAQAGWTDPDLRFWHYRDKDKVEVDCVITRGRDVWGWKSRRPPACIPPTATACAGWPPPPGRISAAASCCTTASTSCRWALPICSLFPVSRLWGIR